MLNGRIAATPTWWGACEAPSWELLLPAIRGFDAVESVQEIAGKIGLDRPEGVNLTLAAKVPSGGIGLSETVQDGIFVPFGTGDVNIAEAVIAQEHSGYTGRCVLEQDTAIMGDAPAPDVGLIHDVRTCLDYLAREVEPRLATVTA